MSRASQPAPDAWVRGGDGGMTIMLQTTPPNPAALARRPDPAGPLAVATPTTRKLADASISRNTRRAYLGAIFEAGRAPATAALAVAAVRFRAKLAGQPAPAGEATARVLGGFRRTAADRGRGQAAPLRADGLAAILATAARPRTDRVVGLSPLQIQRRFTAAARAAGIEARVTAHSGRVGLASELTARGASTTEVMLAGHWKTARMVAHYSAGATAERGAVRKYL